MKIGEVQVYVVRDRQNVSKGCAYIKFNAHVDALHAKRTLPKVINDSLPAGSPQVEFLPQRTVLGLTRSG